MDRIIVQEGGMPLKIQDIGFIHDIYKQAFKSIIDSLQPGASFILSGLDLTDNGTTITVSEGFYYDGDEIFYVQQGSWPKSQDDQVILTRQDTTSENRVFDNDVFNDCYSHRRYVLSYASSVPGGSLEFSAIDRLSDLMAAQWLTEIISKCPYDTANSVLFQTGFTGAGTYNAVAVHKNQLGEVNIHASFDATSANGLLFILPEIYRPVADIAGYFTAGNTIALLKINSDGNVYVLNASTTGSNYINFTFSLNLQNDLVGYNLGGVGIPD